MEAPARSGTLQVARLALEQGRDVYAVPANIDAEAGVGTNQLLVRGEAICVCSGADVLEHYRSLYPRLRSARPLSEADQAQRLAAPVSPDHTPRQPAAPSAPAEATAPQVPSPAPLRQLRLAEHKSEFTDDEIAVLRALEGGALVTDAIVAAAGVPARRVSATLTVLTIRALVRQLPGGRFEALVRLS